jgi:hypothetical protein
MITDNLVFGAVFSRFHMIWLTILWFISSFINLGAQIEPLPILVLNWDAVHWQNGDRFQHLQLSSPDDPDGSIQLVIQIDTRAKGTFEAFDVSSPYLDGREITNFGTQPNLGLMFDPDPGQGNSPVLIKLKFSRPVQYLGFRISDIDAADGRIDSVRIFGNGGEIFPTLSLVSPNPTVRVAGRSAVATGGDSGSARVGSAFGGEETGDILVTFRDEYLDSVTVEYFEASGLPDPAARGIGLFGDLSFQPARIYPMNLLKFGIALDENCQPVVRWVTDQEFGIDEYVVEYSYDGYNFFKAGTIPASNRYTSETEYELPLYRNLNTDNFFRLLKLDLDGSAQILTSEALSGSECFHFTTINVYPNPSSGNFVYVEIESTGQNPADIAIIDQYGEILVQTRYDLNRGRNLFKLESRHLVPGIYNLRFAIDQEVVSKLVTIVD